MKTLTITQRWVYACKLKSWPKILVPFYLGNALGMHYTESPSWSLLFVGGIATALGTVFIVLMNDWGDRRIDALKRSMFPDGCSPKTIPDQILPPRHVLFGGVIAGIAASVLIIAVGSLLLERSLTPWFALLSCVFFIFYTLPPVQLNYRGGGELLEMLGVGAVLPWFMAYLQSGQFLIFDAVLILLSYSFLSLASAIASGLSDEESDRKGGKTTVVTTWGNPVAHKLIKVAYALGVGGAIVALWSVKPLALKIGLGLGVLFLLFYFIKMLPWSKRAKTNAFHEQGIFKLYLHKGIWYFGAVLASVVIIFKTIWG